MRTHIKFSLGVAGVVSLFFLSGCAITGQNYNASFANINALRTIVKKSRPINVAKFTSSEPGQTSIMCRLAGPVEAPQGKTFSAYIHDALVQELQYSKLYLASSKTTLQGHLNKISFDSLPGSGKWIINMTFRDNHHRRYNVVSVYRFSANFDAVSACNQSANALNAAVQKLLRTLYRNSRFQRTLRG